MMNNMKTTNIMIVGVGGQGTLLASRILGNVALKLGMDVKVSEVHGMSQRGGSVVTYVKFGEKVYSPIIERGEADVLMSFEELEALRWMEYLREGGKVIVNKQRIDPMPVITGKAVYPQGIIDKLRALSDNVSIIDALKIAKECGNVKVVNIVLIGLMASRMDIDKQIWLESIKETVPQKLLEMNLMAFELGYSAALL